ncbi:MAG: hypothetical protein Q7J10_09155 [Methanosarcinaceae archaeon]|nr:hypothetical protein [Methanosarcinaceae archaeon]
MVEDKKNIGILIGKFIWLIFGLVIIITVGMYLYIMITKLFFS